MTGIELVRFLEKTDSEYHWEDDIFEGIFNDVYLFINTYDLQEFIKLLGGIFLTKKDIQVTLKEDYFVFKMSEICEYFSIELESVFENKPM